MEEKELIEGCKNNNRYFRKQLYDLYSPVLYAVCLRYTGNRNEAKDLMHDSFIKIFDGIKKFKYEGSFEGWIKRIAVNTTISWIKKNDVLKFSKEINDFDIEEEVDDAKNEISEEKILEFITELPTGYRMVFNMYAVEDYSHKDIAKILNINIGTSLSQYSKAKNMLVKKINNYLKQEQHG